MKIQDVSSLEIAAGLTPGVSLKPLKCWTAGFTGLGCRLAQLPCRSVEGLPTSLQVSCKYTKKNLTGVLFEMAVFNLHLFQSLFYFKVNQGFKSNFNVIQRLHIRIYIVIQFSTV